MNVVCSCEVSTSFLLLLNLPSQHIGNLNYLLSITTDFSRARTYCLIPLVWLPKNNMVEVRQDEVRQEELVENTTLTFLLKEIILVVN